MATLKELSSQFREWGIRGFRQPVTLKDYAALRLGIGPLFFPGAIVGAVSRASFRTPLAEFDDLSPGELSGLKAVLKKAVLTGLKESDRQIEPSLLRLLDEKDAHPLIHEMEHGNPLPEEERRITEVELTAVDISGKPFLMAALLRYHENTPVVEALMSSEPASLSEEDACRAMEYAQNTKNPDFIAIIEARLRKRKRHYLHDFLPPQQ